MKKTALLIAAFIISAGALFAYAAQNRQKTDGGAAKMEKKGLVAYFSATGTTKKVAENLAKATVGDLYEIKPLKPYTSKDLDWTDRQSRSTIEMKDHKSRPETAPDKFSVKGYDTIYLGFPIWWYIAPTIVNTFLEKHDFSGKKIILFATSGGSGLGRSIDNLRPSVSKTATMINGDVLNGNPSAEKLKQWADKC